MIASHKDLLSLQKSTEIEGWLAMVDVQDNADSMAAASSSWELVKVLPLVLMVVTPGIDSNSCRAKGPSDLRNDGGMLSGPAALLPFIFLMADSNSPISIGAQLLLSTDGALIPFLNCWLMSRSKCDILSLLTLA